MTVGQPGTADETWGALLAAASGVPAVDPDGPPLSSMATATAGFRQQYYGLVPFVRERSDGAGMPLVTSGLIEPAELLWGRAPCRFARRRWTAPVVDHRALGAAAPSLGAWVEARRRPKVLVASQTRVIEAVVDADGRLLPSVPVVSVEPTDASDLWRVAAALLSPVASAWMLHDRAGSGLSDDTMRVSARSVTGVPLPTDPVRWDEAAELVRRWHQDPSDRDARRRFVAAAIPPSRCRSRRRPTSARGGRARRAGRRTLHSPPRPVLCYQRISSGPETGPATWGRTPKVPSRRSRSDDVAGPRAGKATVRTNRAVPPERSTRCPNREALPSSRGLRGPTPSSTGSHPRHPTRHPRRHPCATRPVVPPSGAWMPGDPVGDRRFLTLERIGRSRSRAAACSTSRPWPTRRGAPGRRRGQRRAGVPCADRRRPRDRAVRARSPHHRLVEGHRRPRPGHRHRSLVRGVRQRARRLPGNDRSGLDRIPATGRRTAPGSPSYRPRHVRTQALLADELGRRTLESVIGGSMGGMQALEWAITYPERTRTRRVDRERDRRESPADRRWS